MSRLVPSMRDANKEIARRDVAVAVIVISSSAGGLTPLRSLVRRLPTNIPAAVIVAQHIRTDSLLPEILTADTRMPIRFVESGDTLRSGVIYVCPAQHHVVVNPDATLALSVREHVNFFRPNGDWLFASAAASFRERTFAVVLSGCLNDGASGVVTVRSAGGVVIAQDPVTCLRPEMPSAAIATGAVHFVLPPKRVGDVLRDLLMRVDVGRCKAEWDAPFALARTTAGDSADDASSPDHAAEVRESI